jgi:hypothetical protein
MNAILKLQNHRTNNAKQKPRRPLRVVNFAVSAALSALALSGCYATPGGLDANGRPYYIYSTAPVPVMTTQGAVGVPGAVPSGPIHQTLSVKLYPINDLANQTGVLTGAVTNMMTGKGRFTFNYIGETLVGEATRVDNDERRGIASAYGPSGMSVSCEYQMSSPKLGAGTCTFSNNAMYQLHVGS